MATNGWLGLSSSFQLYQLIADPKPTCMHWNYRNVFFDRVYEIRSGLNAVLWRPCFLEMAAKYGGWDFCVC